jgi:hypothetical protein
VPWPVVNIVSSTFVPGRYRRVAVYGTSGSSWNRPPCWQSSSAPNTLTESRSGRLRQHPVYAFLLDRLLFDVKIDSKEDEWPQQHG